MRSGSRPTSSGADVERHRGIAGVAATSKNDFQLDRGAERQAYAALGFR